MRKAIKTAAILTVFLTTLLALSFTAGAGIGGFVVAPVTPEELMREDSSRGIFDIWVTPGQTAELAVEILNQRDETIVVEVSVNTVGTNDSGIISQASTGIFGDTLPFYFEDIATLAPGADAVTIPPMTSATVPVTLQIPAGGFEGEAMGAVFVFLGISEEELEEAGMLVNRFGNATLIRMRIEEPTMEPDFHLGYIRPETINHTAAFVIDVHHPIPRLTRPAITSVWIYQVGNENPIFVQTDIETEYAPHTIFPITLRDNEGFGIVPDDYIARVRIEYDGRVWNLESEFTVHPQIAEEINEGAINVQARAYTEAQGGLSTAVIIAIAGGVILLLLALLLLLKAKNKKASEQIDWSKVPQPGMAGAPPQNASLEDQLKGMDKDELEKLLAQMNKGETEQDSDK